MRLCTCLVVYPLGYSISWDRSKVGTTHQQGFMIVLTCLLTMCMLFAHVIIRKSGC